MSTSKIFEAKKEIKDFKLNVLLEVTNAINDNFSRKELFEIFKSVLKEDLEIGKLILFMYDESWKCAIQYGFSKDVIAIDVQKDLIPLKDPKSPQPVQSVIKPPWINPLPRSNAPNRLYS